MNPYEQFKQLLLASLSENTFVKLTLANYKGELPDLKNCYVKKVLIKQEDKLSFTYRYKTKDIVKNFSIEDGLELIAEFIKSGDFRHASLFTINSDIVLEYITPIKFTLKTKQPTHQQLPSQQHDIAKNRLIEANGKTYLQQLKITDEKGKVIQSSQDKFKQINHYIELLSPLIKNLPKYEQLHVLDMGAGKGYLTFALYDYLKNVLHLNSQVTGVEYRMDLVELCNSIAKNANFEGLSFAQGAIKDFEPNQVNVLIALHACDTATDEAIYKGIHHNADLILVAPCCHKQIRREIEAHKVKNNLDFLLKHGIFLERQAEMVTDGMRSLILEYYGYSTKVVEFISDAHTPKNVMIVAEKKSKTEAQKLEILKKLKETKAYFGIDFHYLEKLMKME